MQHAEVRLPIRLRLKGYFKKPLRDTGADVEHDLKHLRARQIFLEHHFVKNQIRLKYRSEHSTETNWKRKKTTPRLANENIPRLAKQQREENMGKRNT